MSPGDVTSILCPACHEELYRSIAMDNGVQAISNLSPPLQFENGKTFIPCAHCHRNISMTTIPGGPAGTMYDVDLTKKYK